MRIILDADIYTSCHKMHEELELQWLDERRIYHAADQMFKSTHDLAPPRMQQMFTCLDEVNLRPTRAGTRGDLVEEGVKPKVCRGNFKHRGRAIWNFVDPEDRVLISLKEYKTSVRKKDTFPHDSIMNGGIYALFA